MAETVTGSTGTIFLNQNWVPDGVATVFTSLTSTGECVRNMYDRRTASFNWTNAWCFDNQYSDENKTVEVQVNRNDFTESEALTHANFYAEAVGRLPKFLRRDLETLWIHDGMNAFGGGNNNLLIHTL